MRSLSLSKKRLIYILLLFFWAELLSFFALHLIARKYPLLVYKQGGYDALKVAKNLDDDLGWGSDYVKVSNSLIHDCELLLFGDSFVEASTYKKIRVGERFVAPEEYLSEKTNCNVRNYGVGGYGSDQAYLKFQKLVEEGEIGEGDFIYAGHLSENILRNVNRNRSLLYPILGDSTPLLKPVFDSCKPECEVMPLPASLHETDLRQIASLGISPSTSLGESSQFVPNKLVFGSPVTIGFPNLYALLRIPFVWHLYPRFFGLERHDQFYGETERGYKITKNILQRFHSRCKEVGCHVISSDIPVAGDFSQYFRKNRYSTQDLNEELAGLGLRHFSLTGHLIRSNPGLKEDPCLLHNGLLDGGDLCNAHFNQSGYKQFFDFIAGHVNQLHSQLR